MIYKLSWNSQIFSSDHFESVIKKSSMVPSWHPADIPPGRVHADKSTIKRSMKLKHASNLLD